MILFMDNAIPASQNQSQNFSGFNNPQRSNHFKFLNNYIVIGISVLCILSFGSTAYLLTANKKKPPAINTTENTVVKTIPLTTPAISPQKVIAKPQIPTPTAIQTQI